MNLQRTILSKNSQSQMVTCCMTSFVQHFWNEELLEMEERSVVARGPLIDRGGKVKWQERSRCYKRATCRTLVIGNYSISWLWWWIYKHTKEIKQYRIQHTHTEISTTEEIWIRAVDCTMSKYYRVLQNVISGEKRAKCTKDLHIISYNYNHLYKKKKKIIQMYIYPFKKCSSWF